MAKKIYCDGCDRELTTPVVTVWNVQIATGSTTKSNSAFDLCESCGRRLEANADPRQWARRGVAAA